MNQEHLKPAFSLEELESIFTEYVHRVPVSLAVRSTMRMVALSKFIPPGSEVLDVGCGDGCFGLLYPTSSEITLDGVDLSSHELALAQKTGAYRKLTVCDVSTTELGGEYDIAIGNCSMEHVPDIHSAFQNIRRSLRPDGKLLLSVPAHGWTRSLSFVRLLHRFSNRLGMAAGGALDGFFQHHHLYGHETWRFILEGNGFDVSYVGCLGGLQLNRSFERNLPPAFLEFLFKSLLKQYPGWGRRLRAMPSSAVLEEIWNQPTPLSNPETIEYLLVAQRRG